MPFAAHQPASMDGLKRVGHKSVEIASDVAKVVMSKVRLPEHTMIRCTNVMQMGPPGKPLHAGMLMAQMTAF